LRASRGNLPQMGSMVVELDSLESTRVVIADDHAFYREGLARLLGECGVDVVGEAPDGEEAVRLVEETAPDVVVLDLRMPGVSGLEATRRLTERAVPSRVLVLSVSAEGDDVTAAMSAGASGYVLKDEPIEQVVAGIQAVLAGTPRISPRTAAVLLSFVRGTIEAGEDLAGGGLSTIELQVLDLLSAGKSDEEVADALSIGAGTVREYLRSILTKLQVERRVRGAWRAEQD
jgi:DNA-binding NarL/FixJ family response regulator